MLGTSNNLTGHKTSQDRCVVRGEVVEGYWKQSGYMTGEKMDVRLVGLAKNGVRSGRLKRKENNNE